MRRHFKDLTLPPRPRKDDDSAYEAKAISPDDMAALRMIFDLAGQNDDEVGCSTAVTAVDPKNPSKTSH